MKGKRFAQLFSILLCFVMCPLAVSAETTVDMSGAETVYKIEGRVYAEDSDCYENFTADFEVNIEYSESRVALPQVVFQDSGTSNYTLYFDHYSQKSTISLARTLNGEESRLGYALVDLNADDGCSVPMRVMLEGSHILVYYKDFSTALLDIYDSALLTCGAFGFDNGDSAMSVKGFEIGEMSGVETEEFQNEYEVRTAKLLDSLGIMCYDNNGMFYPKAVVTRGAFARIIVLTAGMENLAASQTDVMFEDVSKQHSLYPYINAAAQLGYMTAAEGRRFQPDAPVSIQDAAYALVCAMGYDVLLSGTNSAMTQAANLGLLKDVKDEFCKIDVALMIGRALVEPCLTQSGYGSKNTYTQSEDVTLLSQVFDIEKIEGKVVANEMTSLYGSGPSRENAIQIDDVMYDAGATDISDYIGYVVSAYVKDVENDCGKVVFFETDRAETLTVRSRDIQNTSTRTQLQYYDETSGKIRRANISNTADFLVNMVMASPQNDVFALQNAEVVLIDNDGDGIYDTVSILNYETKVVDRYFGRSAIITDLYDQSQIRPDVNGNEIFLYYLNGVSVTVRDLKRYDVIDVLRIVSADNSKIETRIYVSRKEIQGVIDSVVYGKDGKLEAVTMNEREFDVSDYYTSVNTPELKAGEECSLYLNRFEEVAGANLLTNSHIVLLNDIGYQNGFLPHFTVEILTLNNEWLELNLRDDIKINHVRYDLTTQQGKDTVKNLFYQGEDCKQQLVYIRYGQEVTEIQTAGQQEDMRPLWDGTTLTRKPYIASNGSFESDIFVDSGTVVVVIPENGERDAYYVGGINHLINGAEHTITYYNTDRFRVADYILLDESESRASEKGIQYFFIVDSVSTVLKDDEPVLQLNGFEQNKEKKIVTKDLTTFKDVKKGDVLSVYTDFRGYGTSYKLHYRADGDKVYQSNSGTSLASDLVAVAGDVLDFEVDSSRIRLNTGSEERAYRLLGTSAVYLYEKGRKIITVSDIGEISPGDFVYITFYWNEVRNVVIIRDY